jgi:hypothetical protein
MIRRVLITLTLLAGCLGLVALIPAGAVPSSAELESSEVRNVSILSDRATSKKTPMSRIPAETGTRVAVKFCGGGVTCCDQCRCCYNNSTGRGYCCGPNSRCDGGGACL